MGRTPSPPARQYSTESREQRNLSSSSVSRFVRYHCTVSNAGIRSGLFFGLFSKTLKESKNSNNFIRTQVKRQKTSKSANSDLFLLVLNAVFTLNNAAVYFYDKISRILMKNSRILSKKLKEFCQKLNNPPTLSWS